MKQMVSLCKKRALTVGGQQQQRVLGTRRTRGNPRHRVSVSVYAFKESSQLQDWRVKEMVEMSHKYFVDFITQGNENIAEEIFSDECVHLDVVWDPAHPSVGTKALKQYLHDLKTTFPDFQVDIDEIATCDANGSLWVSYEGNATGLGEWKHQLKASHHSSHFTGVNLFKFNDDRTKIVEVRVYRSAFAEDKEEIKEMVPGGNFRELRLRRLA